MKYIIAAKEYAPGTSTNDIQDPLKVTEIATELIITRLKLIDMLQRDEIAPDDCVVTIDERKCLYSNFFNNVKSWAEFTNITLPPRQEDIIDLLEPTVFMQMAGGEVGSRTIPYLPFYRNWDRDKDIITNVAKSTLIDYYTSTPFVVLVIRRRGAWPEKNMTTMFWQQLITKLNNEGINTLLFGKETESLAVGENVKYIENFQDWCTLAMHRNCKQVVSTMSGGVYPSLIFGVPNVKMTIIDNTNLIKSYGYDPSFYNSCINFSNVDIEFIDRIPTIDEIYAKIVPNL